MIYFQLGSINEGYLADVVAKKSHLDCVPLALVWLFTYSLGQRLFGRKWLLWDTLPQRRGVRWDWRVRGRGRAKGLSISSQCFQEPSPRVSQKKERKKQRGVGSAGCPFGTLIAETPRFSSCICHFFDLGYLCAEIPIGTNRRFSIPWIPNNWDAYNTRA